VFGARSTPPVVTNVIAASVAANAAVSSSAGPILVRAAATPWVARFRARWGADLLAAAPSDDTAADSGPAAADGGKPEHDQDNQKRGRQ